jgi:GNAT superfamily N-acetyltransferase
LIRPAIPEDLDALGDLLLEAHSKEFSRSISLDESRMRYALMQYIVHQRKFSFVSNDVGGGLFGEVERGWNSRELMASDLFFYARDGSGVSLLRAFIKWARRSGASRIVITTTSGMDDERVSRFLEKMGLTKVGAVHMQVLK